MNATLEKLDSYLSSYTKFNDWLIRRRYEYLRQYLTGETCLELGIAEGAGVDNLLKVFKEVTVVDGSSKAIKSIQELHPTPRLHAVHSYFEYMDFAPKSFDTIIMSHILEHVDSPRIVIEQAKKYLAPDGVMIIDVPNGNSLHRQVGVKMGMLKEKTELNSADLSIGHQRVYTPQTFKNEIRKAGLEIVEFGGMFVKVLSNAQMEEHFNKSQLEALFMTGVDNPEIAAEIFIIAKNPA